MRFAEHVLAIAIATSLAMPAAAQETIAFDVPAGSLGAALARFGEQARITIGLSDSAAARLLTRGVRGRMTTAAALSRLLAGTGYSYQFVGPGAVRIVRAQQRDVPVARRRSTPPSSAAVGFPVVEEIIVTGSKHAVPLSQFGGTVRLLDITPDETARIGASGSAYIVGRLPMLSSTNLGRGRNKLFIRGVADSSFNGPSQSIVGQYLGEARLTFGAPDPDLQLYDIERIELLEGPQGTLYGSGSLGGILRVVPARPDAKRLAASVSAGISSTRSGTLGGDTAVMVNLPLAESRAAVRAVAYSALDGGYIDDVGRGKKDVNRAKVFGGRLAFAFDPGNNWTIELSGVVQSIRARDGQYADRDLPPLSRRSVFAQPFGNDYQLANLTIRKGWGRTELISTTSIVRHMLDNSFDASSPASSGHSDLFVEDIDIAMVAHETRLFRRPGAGASWIAGLSLVSNVNRIDRRLGAPGALLDLGGTRNHVREAAVFGELSLPIAGRLSATLGGRVTAFKSKGIPRGVHADDDVDAPDRSGVRALPTAGLNWRVASDFLVYARYQKGFRAGGLTVSGDAGSLTATRFESDSLRSIEVGMRIGSHGKPGLSLDAALSQTRWSDIQADLIEDGGLPYTTNIGDGRILGMEIDASWRSATGWTLSAAAFVNDSALSEPEPRFAEADERHLPNIAKLGVRVAARYETALGSSARLKLEGAARYVGESQLAIGRPFDFDQGNYTQVDLGARLDFRRFGVTVDIANLGDVRGNRFSFGNPFTAGDGRQITPLRPRTVRIGVDASF